MWTTTIGWEYYLAENCGMQAAMMKFCIASQHISPEE
jgi:hypothetical protein